MSKGMSEARFWLMVSLRPSLLSRSPGCDRHDEPNAQSSVLIKPFPVPGRFVQLAYRELDLLSNGAQDQLLALGDLRDLPRPWDPATCQTPQLRKEVWSWLEAVITWLNHDYIWDVADVIPPCWP
jgi:hypothetical protein